MGYTLHECKNCSHSYKDNETRTDGHAYTKKTTVVAATCTTAGEVKWTCEICGYSYNETVNAKGHKWGEWVVTKEPTTEAEGQETRNCATCGATETRAVDKLPEGDDDFCEFSSTGEHAWRDWVSVYDENGNRIR